MAPILSRLCFYGQAAETVEEESSEKERSSCSGGNVDKDAIQPVQLLPILERDDDEEGIGVFLPKHMHCASHTLNLVVITDVGKALNKCDIYQKYYCSAFADTRDME